MSEVAQPLLFSGAESEGQPVASPSSETPPVQRRAPRIKRPERHQVKMFCESLEGRLDDDHPVRVVWQVVESLDLSALDDAIKALEGSAGRDASDPRVLFALCLYAAVDGVSSARELAVQRSGPTADADLIRALWSLREINGVLVIRWRSLAGFHRFAPLVEEAWKSATESAFIHYISTDEKPICWGSGLDDPFDDRFARH